MTRTLIEESSPVHVNGSTYHWKVPDGWQQGRGAFGGLVMAAMIRALEDACGDASRALRLINATLCGPVMPGRADITIETMREGRGTTTLGARLTQGDALRTYAVATFGKRRVEDGDWREVEAPEITSWREIDPVPVQPPMGPVFAQHVDFRPTGHFPYSGAEERRAEGWVNFKRPGEARDAAFIAAHADAWWPAAFAAFRAPRPMATVGFMLELLGDLEGLDPAAPLLHSARSQHARGGYASERRELWGEGGRLLAVNQQSFAIIK